MVRARALRRNNRRAERIRDFEGPKGDFAAELPEAPVNGEDEEDGEGAADVGEAGEVFLGDASDGCDDRLAGYAEGGAVGDVGRGRAFQV